MTMKLKSYERDIPALDLARFDWDRENNALVAEASDLGHSQLVHRLYDDACDLGIAIRSHHTGKVKRFVLAGTDKSGDDVAGWRFNPVDGVGPSVLIIND
jgi:hypothetical protein